MLNFNECKKILNKEENNKYTDEQVKEVNEFAEMLADIIISNNLLEQLKIEENG